MSAQEAGKGSEHSRRATGGARFQHMLTVQGPGGRVRTLSRWRTCQRALMPT